MRTSALVLAVALLGAAAPSFSHHSGSLFDRARTIEIKGTIVEFNWGNPHASFAVDVAGENGLPSAVWYVEMQGAQSLVRQGWKRTTIAVGDEVTVTVNPLRDGKPGGAYNAIVLPNGTRLSGASGS